MIRTSQAPVKNGAPNLLLCPSVLKLFAAPLSDKDARGHILFTLALVLRDAGVPRSAAAHILKGWYEKHFPPRPPRVVGLTVGQAYARPWEKASWQWIERLSGIPISDDEKRFFSDLEPGAFRRIRHADRQARKAQIAPTSSSPPSLEARR